MLENKNKQTLAGDGRFKITVLIGRLISRQKLFLCWNSFEVVAKFILEGTLIKILNEWRE